MPTTSEKGCGRRSVMIPTTGWSREAVELERERDEPDLAEVQAVGGLYERVYRWQQRLHHVVEEMREAQRHYDGERASLCACGQGVGRR